MNADPGIIVIGGGVAGCGVAWQLAERGADVMLIERAVPGAGATHAAAGMLTPEAEAGRDPAFLSLARNALDRWPAFAQAVRAASDIDPGYVRSGRIEILNAAPVVEHTPAIQGARARPLDGAKLRSLEPALAEDVSSGVLFPDDGSADPRALGSALAEAARRAGARIVQDEAVAVECGPDGVRTVVLRERGRVATSTVVIAAGAWASAIEGLPPTPEIRPVRGDMLAVQADEPVLRHIIWTSACYLVPRPDERVLIGSTMDDVGFLPGPSLAGVAALAAAAARVCPELGRLPIAETWSGYRPASSDGLPVLGADARAPGVFHAGGLFRNGILLAPVVAEEIARQVLGHEPAALLAQFAPQRSMGE